MTGSSGALGLSSASKVGTDDRTAVKSKNIKKKKETIENKRNYAVMFLFLVKQLHSWSYCNLSTVPTKLIHLY